MFICGTVKTFFRSVQNAYMWISLNIYMRKVLNSLYLDQFAIYMWTITHNLM